MKTIITPFIFCVLFLSCTKEIQQKESHSFLSVVVDITDPMKLYPSPNSILEWYNFAENPNKKASFRLNFISDTHLNPSTEISIPDGATSEKLNEHDEVTFRENVVASFQDSVTKSFSNYHTEKSSLGNSECFTTIAKELTILAQSDVTQRVLLVYSDLEENSLVFNCYSLNEQQLLHFHSEKVVAIFELQHLLPQNLKGIKVVFVYLPKDRNDDQKFEEMIGVYKALLEKRGATISIQATNKITTS